MEKIKQEEGFVLVLCMVIMVVLTIIGVAAIRDTSVELQIAGNDRLYQKTFYGAEGGAMLATEILEQNINCAAGFQKTGLDSSNNPVADIEGRIRVHTGTHGLAFYLDNYPWTTTDCNITNTAQPNISYPISNLGSGTELSRLYVGGVSSMLAGGALQMAAGYEGKGKGAASGGAVRMYDIISNNQDIRNAQATVIFGWQHVVNTEGDCVY